MSFEATNKKMVTTPPAKKGFHFPATVEYLAEYIEAETIEEAEKIYQSIKRRIEPIDSGVGGTVSTANTDQVALDPAAVGSTTGTFPQSTAPIDEEEKQ